MSNQLRTSVCSLERTLSDRAGVGRFEYIRPQACRPEARHLDAGLYPARVFVDATYTLGSGRHSGIERVVNNLRLGCEQLAKSAGARAATLMSCGGGFYEVGYKQKQMLDRITASQADIVRCLPKMYRHCIRPLVQLTRSDRIKEWLLPEPGHMGMFKLPYRYWYKQILQRICSETQRIEPGRGDLLIMPDAYWARKEVWDAVALARANGAFVVVVVYDLIPLTHPEFVGPRRTKRFGDYLQQVAINADLILTISKTVRNELEETLPKLMGSMPYCRNISAFPLGAEFSPPQGKLRPEVEQLFTSDKQQNPYLTVAAFDPRKNHRYLLDAFDRYWESHPDQKLCLVGRVGSRCDDVMERIKNHPRLGKQLFTFHDLSDAELQHCYRWCRSVIFPSIVEGFGLPIVEALWQGQRTLASDTPIHREVGGDRCSYFDLANPDSLVQLLIDLDQRPHSSLETTACARPHAWSESVSLFYDQCLAAFRLRA